MLAPKPPPSHARHCGACRTLPAAMSALDRPLGLPLLKASVSHTAAEVNRALRLLLLFGALTGLLGQAIASASAPQGAPQGSSHMSASRTMAMAGMSADCMEAMARQQPDPASKPCKGLTLACIAAMGCAVPMILREDGTAIASRRGGDDPVYWPAAMVLRGSDLSPEPEPPTLLD